MARMPNFTDLARRRRPGPRIEALEPRLLLNGAAVGITFRDDGDPMPGGGPPVAALQRYVFEIDPTPGGADPINAVEVRVESATAAIHQVFTRSGSPLFGFEYADTPSPDSLAAAVRALDSHLLDGRFAIDLLAPGDSREDIAGVTIDSPGQDAFAGPFGPAEAQIDLLVGDQQDSGFGVGAHVRMAMAGPGAVEPFDLYALVLPDVLVDTVQVTVTVASATAGEVTEQFIVGGGGPTVTVNPRTTTDRTPSLSGSIDDPDATVSVAVAGSVYVAENLGSTWRLADNVISPALPLGTYDVVVTATNQQGASGIDPSTNELVIRPPVPNPVPVVTVDPLLTNDPSPELGGTVNDATALVTVVVDGQSHTAVNAGARWRLGDDVLAPLDDGTWNVSVSATNANGTGFDGTTDELMIDTVAPAVTVDDVITGDDTPALGGGIDDPDAAVRVEVDGQAHDATNLGSTWTLADDVLAALAPGTYDVTVIATDALGNEGVDTSIDELTVDTSVPIVTVTPLTTGDRTPRIVGTVNDAAATVRVEIDGRVIEARNVGDGTWSVERDQVDPPLDDGTYDVVVTATSATDREGGDATTDELTVDGTPPEATFDAFATADATPALQGTIDDPLATVRVRLLDQTLDATNHGDGTWSIGDDVAAAIPDGRHDVEISATDPVGNFATLLIPLALVVDTVAPVITTAPQRTSDPSPDLAGTVDDPTALVTVTIDGVTYDATLPGDGTWRLGGDAIAGPLLDGAYDVIATATDPVGNAGIDVAGGALVIDTSAPSAALTVPNDADGDKSETVRAAVAAFEVTFSETVDDATVNGASVQVRRDGLALVLGADYDLDLSANPVLSIESIGAPFGAGTYEIVIGDDIADLAGNTIEDPTYTVLIGLSVALPAKQKLTVEEDGASIATIQLTHADGTVTFAGDDLVLAQVRNRMVVRGRNVAIARIEIDGTDPRRSKLLIRSRAGLDVGTITGGGMKSIDLKHSRLVGNTIDLDGPLGSLKVASISDGAHVRLGGTGHDRLTLTVAGHVGDPGSPAGADGVDLVFPGTVKKAAVKSWTGGQWTVGAVGSVRTSAGGFTPSVDIAGGFKGFDVRGGDFRPAEFRSGTADGDGDGDAFNDGDGDGGKIAARAGRDGVGGAVDVAGLVSLDGDLKSLEGRTIRAELDASGEVKRIATKDRDGGGTLDGTFTAARFGRIDAQGRTVIDVIATATSLQLGRKAAIDALRITGANWSGGRVVTQPGTRVKLIQVKSRKSKGGLIDDVLMIESPCVDTFKAGDVQATLTLEGDLGTGQFARVIDSTLHIKGDVLRRLTTRSRGELVGFAGGVLDLVNDDAPGGALRIDGLTDEGRIRTA